MINDIDKEVIVIILIDLFPQCKLTNRKNLYSNYFRVIVNDCLNKDDKINAVEKIHLIKCLFMS